MKRELVYGRAIKSIGYGFYSSKLEIEFDGGKVIQFLKVPSFVFEGIKSAASYILYYQNNIEGKYNYKVVKDFKGELFNEVS